MGNSKEFLHRVMDQDLYYGFPESKRLYLASVDQSEASIVDVLTNYSEEFAKEYFSEILGFQDTAAATRFVSEITSNKELLLCKEIYENTHEKLISPVLKAKYTMARNKARLPALSK